MEASYQIPLIPQDLRHEENIIQIADVLDHFNNVMNDVFNKLHNKIDENSKRMKAIQGRIDVCNNKVDQLIGINKATKVMCSAKYPAMECHRSVESVFKNNIQQSNVVRTQREIKTKPTPYSDKEIQDKLEFYHVKVGCLDPVQAILEKSLQKHHEIPPNNIRAVGCLMLYGTEETVYGSAVRGGTGPIGGLGLQLAKEATEKVLLSPLHEPPATVATRESHNKGQYLYLYSPNMEEVPTMDMPQDLPHLSGIAGDMKFQLEAEATIAPSARVQNLTLSPPVNSSNVEVQAEEKSVVLCDDQNSTNKKQEPVTPKVEVKMVEKMPTQTITPTMGTVPPPPPPPPPPAPPLEETDSKENKASFVKRIEAPPISATTDGRASLMEAIRKAGGSGKARLKSVTATAKQENGNKNVSISGGDLMADLHAKLSMRRKGISGARQGGAEGTILAAISAIIPPPPEADAQSNSEVSSTEDDWE